MKDEIKLIAITGAAGFVGLPLVQACIEAGYRVRVLSRSKNNNYFPLGVDVFNGNLMSTLEWHDFVDGVDVIINTAAELNDEENMFATNVTGPKRLLIAAQSAGVKHWVQLSSVGAYGASQQGVVNEQTPDNPIGFYENSKTDFDNFLRTTSLNGRINSTILRPSIIYGPGMRNKSLTQMMHLMRKGLFAYIGPKGASANYVFVNDVVKAILLSIELPAAINKTYIVSDWAELECMVAAMAKGLNISAPTLRIPIIFANIALRCMGWLPKWPLTKGRIAALTSTARYSSEKIEKELGWRISIPIEVGMNKLASSLQ